MLKIKLIKISILALFLASISMTSQAMDLLEPHLYSIQQQPLLLEIPIQFSLNEDQHVTIDASMRNPDELNYTQKNIALRSSFMMQPSTKDKMASGTIYVWGQKDLNASSIVFQMDVYNSRSRFVREYTLDIPLTSSQEQTLPLFFKQHFIAENQRVQGQNPKAENLYIATAVVADSLDVHYRTTPIVVKKEPGIILDSPGKNEPILVNENPVVSESAPAEAPPDFVVKKHQAIKVASTTSPQKESFLSAILNNPLFSAVICLVLFALIFFGYRKYKLRTSPVSVEDIAHQEEPVDDTDSNSTEYQHSISYETTIKEILRLYSQKEYAEADALTDKILIPHPHDLTSLLLRTHLKYQLNHPSEFIQYSLQCKRAHIDNADWEVICAMGREICPDEHLYQTKKAEPTPFKRKLLLNTQERDAQHSSDELDILGDLFNLGQSSTPSSKTPEFNFDDLENAATPHHTPVEEQPEPELNFDSLEDTVMDSPNTEVAEFSLESLGTIFSEPQPQDDVAEFSLDSLGDVLAEIHDHQETASPMLPTEDILEFGSPGQHFSIQKTITHEESTQESETLLSHYPKESDLPPTSEITFSHEEIEEKINTAKWYKTVGGDVEAAEALKDVLLYGSPEQIEQAQALLQ